MSKYLSRLFLVFQIIILGFFSFFLFFRIFFPYSRGRFSPQIEISPEKIVFEAKLNSNSKDILNLISFDVASYIDSLGLWDGRVFQKRLDERSLIWTGLDLEIFQEWIITNHIDYYHFPFKGRVFFIFEGDNFYKEVEARLLIKNYESLALENMIFLGLGLKDFLINSSFPSIGSFSESKPSVEDFLESLFKRPNLRIIIDRSILPERRCKVKVLILK